MSQLQMNRRGAIASLLAISAAGALSACGKIEQTPALVSGLAYAEPMQFFRADEMALIAAIADRIIPTTDTPGAVAVGVPEKLQALASEWADDGFRLFWRDGLAELNNALMTEGTAFADLPVEQQMAVLSAYDASVYSDAVENDLYKNLKSTVATAYYMSEPGATQELAYEAVPGAWIGDAPLSDYPKTWAT